MRILLTNDDGIRAPGIAAMHGALLDTRGRHGGPLGEVCTIAPLTVQSATGHGVTFHQPLMVSPEDIDVDGTTVRGIAVDGRPADCVKLAVANLWPERYGEGSRPDLLISGMNYGANAGINVIYSGTVAAALEGAFLGVPAIAVSLHRGSGAHTRFDVAATWARRTIDAILAHGLPERHACLSINIPLAEDDADPGTTPPVRVCPMNTHGLVDAYERRVSPSGDVYYWSSGHGLDFRGIGDGTDVHALLERCITVTPLWYDLTAHAAMTQWRERLESAGAGRTARGQSPRG